MTTPTNNSQGAEGEDEHVHTWALAWNNEQRENFDEEDKSIFWRSLWLCNCGSWKPVKHKYVNEERERITKGQP